MIKINETYLNSHKTYVIRCYYGTNFTGLQDDYETDDYDDMVYHAWELINKGPIEIENTETGESVRYSEPDEIYYEGEVNIALESKEEMDFCKKAYENAVRKNESYGDSRTYTLEEIKREYGIK